MRCLWKILAIIGVVFALVLLISVIHHYQLRAATENYIAELKTKGEPMDLAQVLPPPVPPDQNGADLLRQAVAVLNASNQTILASNYFYGGMKMVAPGKAAVVTEQPELRDYDTTNSWDEVQTAVAQNADAFTLLHQIIEKPNFDFAVRYEKGISDLGFTNLFLSEAKAAALRLGTASLNHLHQKDTAAATKDVRAMLAIANGMSQERLIISELVRLAIVAIAVPDTWEMLQSTNVTDRQLAVLQRDWMNLEFVHMAQNAFETERVVSRIDVSQWRNSNSELERMFTGVGSAMDYPELNVFDRLGLESRVFRWRYWWSYPDELRSLRGSELMLQAFRAAQTNDSLLSIQNELQSNIAKLGIPTNDSVWLSDPTKEDLHFVLSDSVLSSAKAVSRIIRIEMQKRMVITAIALKRYHMKHNEYPATLKALVPDFLPEVRRDVDGHKLRYRLNADGSFTLYSVGDDGKDDGGDPSPAENHKNSLMWNSGRDWVWPQPATVEEIQKFYANPPK